jgi:hypothetical protein
MAFIVKREVISAGFGLPAQIIITDGTGSDGTYNKKSQGNYVGNIGGGLYYAGNGIVYNKSPDAFPNYDFKVLLGPNAIINNELGDPFLSNGSTWASYVLYNDDGEQYSTINSNYTSEDPNNVPTIGWIPNATITAA